MKRFFFVTLYLFTFGFISNIQSQTIRGQLICKSLEKVDSLPGILVAYDSISTISDIKGRFIFDKIKKYPESIQISGILCPKLLITNLTKGYKLLDLGQIELIEHLIISTSQYDSLVE